MALVSFYFIGETTSKMPSQCYNLSIKRQIVNEGKNTIKTITTTIINMYRLVLTLSNKKTLKK